MSPQSLTYLWTFSRLNSRDCTCSLIYSLSLGNFIHNLRHYIHTYTYIQTHTHDTHISASLPHDSWTKVSYRLLKQNSFFTHPANIYSFYNLSHLRQQYCHLFSCSSPKPRDQLLFHSHVQSTYIQFNLPPRLIFCTPDHINSLGLPASILALVNPFSTQQPEMLKQYRSCCYLTQNTQSLLTTFIVKILHWPPYSSLDVSFSHLMTFICASPLT